MDDEDDMMQAFPSTMEDNQTSSQTDGSRSKKQKSKGGGFQAMGLGHAVLKGVFNKGYRLPTPIQRKVIPVAMNGSDVVAMARTGSGKTAAFLVPLLEKLKAHSARVGARALILSPTRELAMQTMRFASELGRYTDLRAALLVGGDSLEEQFEALSRNPDVLVATPGRLLHHIAETKMSLSLVQFLVFDEADRLFEMGLAEQLKEIMDAVGSNRQTLLFSATMPSKLLQFSMAGLRDPQIVRLDVEHTLSDQLGIAFFLCRNEEKLSVLVYILRTLIGVESLGLQGYVTDTPWQGKSKTKKRQKGTQPKDVRNLCMIFVATKHHADFVQTLLQNNDIRSLVIHGNMDQETRSLNLSRFRRGNPNILIVTDVAARGIDVPLLDFVINFNFPGQPKLFVHRCGRVARAGRKGIAFNIVAPDEHSYMVDLHLFLGYPIRCQSASSLIGGDEKSDISSPIERLLSSPYLKPGEPYYGRVPQTIIDNFREEVEKSIKESPDLQAQDKVTVNAQKLYTKTRPLPSAESVKRARKIDTQVIHPLLMQYGGVSLDEVSRECVVNGLKKFRPPQTILELRAKEAPKKYSHGGDIMKAKRGRDDNFIQKNVAMAGAEETAIPQNGNEVLLNADPEERVTEVISKFQSDPKRRRTRKRKGKLIVLSEGDQDDHSLSLVQQVNAIEGISVEFPEEDNDDDPAAQGKKRKRQASTGDFTDDKFYISHYKADRHTEEGFSMAGDSMDMQGDDESSLYKKKQQTKWDRKRMKFVQVQAGININDPTQRKRLRKDEAGNIIKSDKLESKRYKEWQKKTHRTIPTEGEEEKKGDPHSISLEKWRVRKHYHHKTDTKPQANGSAKDELRSESDVRKLKQQKAFNKLKQQKGWKGKLAAQNRAQKIARREAEIQQRNTRSRIVVHQGGGRGGRGSRGRGRGRGKKR